MSDVSAICIGRDPRVKLYRKIKFTVNHPKIAASMLRQRYSNRSDIDSIQELLAAKFGFCPPINFIEHHRAHLASAFYSSPFEDATLVSVDGSGDFTTVMIGKGSGQNIEILESQDFPVSIGLFYTAFTQFLGFPHYGDEYKVMGLSPYGTPKYIEELRSMIWSGEDQIIEWNSKFFQLSHGVVSYEANMPRVNMLFNEKQFEKLFGKKRNKNEQITQRHKDISSSLQKRTEELVFEIIERAFNKTKIPKLCLAGGVAQNSVANGKILNSTNIDEIYIPSAGHDAGISMGAAQFHYFNNLHN